MGSIIRWLVVDGLKVAGSFLCLLESIPIFARYRNNKRDYERGGISQALEKADIDQMIEYFQKKCMLIRNPSLLHDQCSILDRILSTERILWGMQHSNIPVSICSCRCSAGTKSTTLPHTQLKGNPMSLKN